ncbi:MAG: hypothetical protein AAF483_11380 [Planctomycetota bacterium]
MFRQFLRRLSIASASALVLLLHSTSSADVITWDAGGGDGLWNTATNWDSDAVPQSDDTVIIDSGDSVAGPDGNLPRAVINLSNNSSLST